MKIFLTEWYELYIEKVEDDCYTTELIRKTETLREAVKLAIELQKQYKEEIKIDKWVYDNGNGYPEPIELIEYKSVMIKS